VLGVRLLTLAAGRAGRESVSCVAVRSVRGAAIKRPRLTLRDLLKAIGVGMACYSFIFPLYVALRWLDGSMAGWMANASGYRGVSHPHIDAA